MDRIRIGTMHLVKPIKRRTSEEVAAWFTEVEFQPQSAPLYLVNRNYNYSLTGVIVDENYQALFGGVAIGAPYKPEHLGQEYTMGFTSYDYTLAYLLVEHNGLLGVPGKYATADMWGYMEIHDDVVEIFATKSSMGQHMHMLTPNAPCDHCGKPVRPLTEEEREPFRDVSGMLTMAPSYCHFDAVDDANCPTFEGKRWEHPWPSKDSWITYNAPSLHFGIKLKESNATVSDAEGIAS